MLGLSQLSIKFKANSNMMSPVMQGVHVQCNCIWGRSDLPAFEGNGTMHWRELNCIALHSRELNCVQLILARWIAVREEAEMLHGLMIIRDLRLLHSQSSLTPSCTEDSSLKDAMVISVFSRSDLRGRWVSVTIITVTSSPYGRCMCMMHNFAVHQFVTSRAALTSYLHHFILPGWHGCISSLTSIRQRLRLGNLSLVIYVLDDDRSQNLSNRRIWFSWPPHIPQVDDVPHSSPTMVASNRKPGIIGCVFSRPDILDLKYSGPKRFAHLSWLKLVLTQLFAQHRKSWTFGDRALYFLE